MKAEVDALMVAARVAYLAAKKEGFELEFLSFDSNGSGEGGVEIHLRSNMVLQYEPERELGF